jgi:hypothetical protein
MNDEANTNCDGLRVSEVFQRQYATVVLQLKEANKQVLPFLFLGPQRFLGFPIRLCDSCVHWTMRTKVSLSDHAAWGS